MLGKPVPDFSLPSTGGGTFRLSSARTSKLVLYFYPKDNTLRRFARRAAVRRDQDEEHVREKGPRIERSTFVIDEKRGVVREWRGVKVSGHVQEVLNFVKAP